MKLGWGFKRLNELKVEVEEFNKDAHLITRHDDVEKSRHRVLIEQKVTPDAIGMLLGEFAYLLRSGLDNLAWQLALLTTDTPARRTCFPIDSVCPSSTDKGYLGKIEHIPPAAVTVIESLQPYKSGAAFKNHPLWQLNRLCNIDKHQVVAISHVPFEIGVENVSARWRRDLQHVIEISVPLAEKDNLQLNVSTPPIVFGEPIDKTDGASDFEVTINGLRGIYDFVRKDAIPRFDQFFS